MQEAGCRLVLELVPDVVGKLSSSVSVVVGYHFEILVGFKTPLAKERFLCRPFIARSEAP
jgi:hypothetical protein